MLYEVITRQLCDLELLATGVFSPLDGFMTRSDYESVLDRRITSYNVCYTKLLRVPVRTRGNGVLFHPEGGGTNFCPEKDFHLQIR